MEAITIHQERGGILSPLLDVFLSDLFKIKTKSLLPLLVGAIHPIFEHLWIHSKNLHRESVFQTQRVYL